MKEKERNWPRKENEEREEKEKNGGFGGIGRREGCSLLIDPSSTFGDNSRQQNLYPCELRPRVLNFTRQGGRIFGASAPSKSTPVVISDAPTSLRSSYPLTFDFPCDSLPVIGSSTGRPEGQPNSTSWEDQGDVGVHTCRDVSCTRPSSSLSKSREDARTSLL